MPDLSKQIPFNPTRPAIADVFIGRWALKRQIVNGLHNGLCFELIGSPGIGKTSLLLAVQDQFVTGYGDSEEGYIPLAVYADCSRKHTLIEEVFVSIINNVKECLQTQRKLTCPTDILNRSIDEGKRGRLDVALEVLLNWAYLREKRTHQLILLIDNLHRLNSPSLIYDFISVVTTLIDQQQLALVLAGRHSLVKEFRNDVSPLRPLIAQQLILGMLSREETQLLVAKVSDYGWSLEEGCIDLAYELTHGHPYRLHYYLYGVLSTEGRVTAEGLLSVHRSETLQHLNMLLQDSEVSQQSSRSIFVSYSHKDETEKKTLQTHLSILEHIDLIDIWSDDEISGGADWQADIDAAISKARIAILLITSNFLTSEFILEQEVPRLLQHHRTKGLIIFPIIARACAWREVEWLTKMNVRPKNGKPIWSDPGSHVDEDLATIVEELATIVRM